MFQLDRGSAQKRAMPEVARAGASHRRDWISAHTEGPDEPCVLDRRSQRAKAVDNSIQRRLGVRGTSRHIARSRRPPKDAQHFQPAPQCTVDVRLFGIAHERLAPRRK